MVWQFTFSWHLGLCAALLLLTACDMPSITRTHTPKHPHQSERMLGYMSLDDSESAPRIHAYRITKGYAVKSHLHDGEDHDTRFVVSKNKEYKWFAGLEWRYEF